MGILGAIRELAAWAKEDGQPSVLVGLGAVCMIFAIMFMAAMVL